jgi:ABC-type transport system involved in multi-copper enzyme maturation permease subunit
MPEVIGILFTILFGMFVGAPLVARELEFGTHRLVWTQNITRLRWLSVKFAMISGIAILLFSLLTVLLYWGTTPLYQFYFPDRMETINFDGMGPVYPASAMLALALGILAGTLTRRTVLAMLLTLVLILAIRLPVENVLRPNYQPPITIIQLLGPNNEMPIISGSGKWIFDTGTLDPHGNKTNQISCPTSQPCGYSSYYTYQPLSRYWTFQWIETGIYLAFSVLAFGMTIWLIKRRIN